MTESDEVFVAMTHSGETTRSSSAKTLLLHPHLLEHRLDDESAAGEDVEPRVPGHDRAEEPRLPRAHAASLHEVGEFVTDPGDALVDLLLREVAHHDGHFETAQEEQCELARHEPRADDTDLLDAARLDVGHPDAAFGAALDEVERVHRGLSLSAGKEVCQRVLLGAVSLVERPGCGAFDQIERAIGRGRRSVDLAVEACSRLPAHLGDVREIGRRSPLSGTLLDLVQQERDRVVEELDRLEERVRVAGLECLLRVQHPVLPERALDDEPDGLLGADELRHELRASPARDEPEEDLRTREVPHGRRDRAVVAVERDLHSPAERRPVDRRDGDERQLADPAEELVPGLPAQAGSLGRDLAELADVGADREHERLAREEQPSPVPGPELIEHAFERAERDLAECVRPLPVLAVVHRHERDRTDARGELPELELRRCASHRSGGSPRGSRRPCPSRCRAR